jgi:hypothetical protein
MSAKTESVNATAGPSAPPFHDGNGPSLAKQAVSIGADIGVSTLIRVVYALKGLDPGYHAESAGSREVQREYVCNSTSERTVVAPGGKTLADVNVDEGAHWLPYAAASYKHTRADVISTLHALGNDDVIDDDILYAALEPSPLVPAHLIIRDRGRKALVVTIRGTATVRDILADAAALPIPFGGGNAHTGMAAAVDGLLHYRVPHGESLVTSLKDNAEPQARAVVGDASQTLGMANPTGFTVPLAAAVAQQQDHTSTAIATAADNTSTARAGGYVPASVYPCVQSIGVSGVLQLLQGFLTSYPDYRVVITGHSLGAGIASLLTWKLCQILFHFRCQQVVLGSSDNDIAQATGAQHASNSSSPPWLSSCLIPPRPINCWAFAAPTSMSPELAVLASLSQAELEDALLQDEPFLCKAVGEAAAQRFIAAGKRRNERCARLSAGGDKTAEEHVSNADDADDFVMPAEWCCYRNMPRVTSVVFADDMVSVM